MNRREEFLQENNVVSETSDSEESDNSDSDDSDSEESNSEESNVIEESESVEDFDDGLRYLCGKVAYEMRMVDPSLRSDTDVSKPLHSKHCDRLYSGK